MINLSQIGVRGLVISVGEKFFYVAENDWREKTAIAEPAAHSGQVGPRALASLGVAVAKLSGSAFVNLDALANLEQSDLRDSPPAKPRAPSPKDLEGPGVLIHEEGKFYLVPKTMWKDLEATAAGDAGVLVKRGAVVASVPPNDIPTGTFCVLVNWNGLFAE